MSPRKISSATDTRHSQITAGQGGWFLAYGIRSDPPGDWSSASLCFFFDEAAAHRAAKLWERDSVEPRSADTWTRWPAVTDAMLDIAAEQLEANRS